jgi:hypothetical protein
MTPASFIFLLNFVFLFAEPFQRDEIPDEVCLNPTEVALLEALNNYRRENQLPDVALSRSLTKVAQLHSKDLAIHQPHGRGNCNMHSWSKKGPWTACCYTPDHKRAECMWRKPRELTAYTGDGFEIAFFSSATYTDAPAFARDALNSWKRSKGHNDVIINRGTWKSVNWKAIGVGYYEGYATVWFGMLDDPDTNSVEACMQ